MIDLANLCGMVAEGGGAKGYAYGGVPAALQKLGLLQKITDIAGTSAGAIFCMQMALGATHEEIWRETMSNDFGVFLDRSLPAFFHVLKNWSIFSPSRVEEWLRQQITKYAGDPEFTFGQLSAQAGKTINGRQYRNLVVTATDLVTRRPVFLSARSYPDMPIWKAVRASMCLPLIWPPVRYDKMLLVDGGLAMNLPFRGLSYIPDERIFGLRVDSRSEISARAGQFPVIGSLWKFISSIMGMLIDQANSAHLCPIDFIRTVMIDCGDVTTMEFQMTTGRKLSLLVKGYQDTISYFQGTKWLQRTQALQPGLLLPESAPK